MFSPPLPAPSPLPLPRARPLLAALLGLTLTACGTHRTFVSPTTPQGMPAFLGPPRPLVEEPLVLPPEVLPKEPPPTINPNALTFFKTQSSTAWVKHNFHLQTTYTRVILVGPKATAPATIRVGMLDLETGADGTTLLDLPVTTTVATLQEAANLAQGGDLVAIQPGHYAGFTLDEKADAGDERFIHVKALGQPGEVVIDAPCPADPKWLIVLSAAHHVVLQGLNLAGENKPKAPPTGPKSGLLITGDFLRTTKLAHHIAFVGNFSHNHKYWGLHSVDSHTVLIEDSLFAYSAIEHGCYISDGSDDYVVRRNVFTGNNASGLQANIDPVSSLEKLKEHPALAEEAGPYTQTREYALRLIQLATQKFGDHAFPDGRGFNFIIEDNVMTENGKIGGAAINLAGVRESLIQNNLVYNTGASGIVEWDNGNPYDAAQIDPGPESEAELVAALPLFGCFGNVVRNNTIFTKTRGRPALLVGNGSFGTRAFNNILINEIKPSITFTPTGIYRFEGSRNVVNTLGFDGNAAALVSMATAPPNKTNTAMERKWIDLEDEFMRPNVEPWVVIEKGWWKLNKRRPLYRPRSTSVTLAGTGDPRELPPNDLEGRPRRTADIGAYAASLPPKAGSP